MDHQRFPLVTVTNYLATDSVEVARRPSMMSTYSWPKFFLKRVKYPMDQAVIKDIINGPNGIWALVLALLPF